MAGMEVNNMSEVIYFLLISLFGWMMTWYVYRVDRFTLMKVDEEWPVPGCFAHADEPYLNNR